VITDAVGHITAESDYLPWGGEIQFTSTDKNDYKFNGKKRDTETSLDYFGARYYSNAIGRFLSADWAAEPANVPYANFADPQTLNLYSYVRNIPTSYADSTGHLASVCLMEGILGCEVMLVQQNTACPDSDVCDSLKKINERNANKRAGAGWRTDAEVHDVAQAFREEIEDGGGVLVGVDANGKEHTYTSDALDKMSDAEVARLADEVHAAWAAGPPSEETAKKLADMLGKVATTLTGLPGANPAWGKNRFVKELHSRGFKYEGPTKSDNGLMYKNPQTGEEVRIMPKPNRQPYAGEPAAKFENDWYYRYRSGPDQAWGPHTTLPNK
jgi:RHS repeat-associated protein